MLRCLPVWVCLLCAGAWAEYLSDYQVDTLAAPPSYAYGLGYTGRYFASGLDHWAGANAHWRLGRHWAAVGEGALSLSRSGYSMGSGMRWYARGRLRRDAYEDFVTAGMQRLGMGDYGTWLAFVGGGRDVLPWKSASFGLRLDLRLEYALAGDDLRRVTKNSLVEETKLARTALSFAAVIFFL